MSWKVHGPRVQPGYVRRERLVARLESAVGRGVAVVCAPAGWGKSALLAEWLAADRDAAVAWLTLDEGDRDPVSFVVDLVEALRVVVPGIGASALAAVRSPGAGTADGLLAVVMPLLLNDVAACARPVVLVLDDYHLARSPAIEAATALLLERRPDGLRVLVSTRTALGFPVARLRARGVVGDVGIRQLRFTPEEAEQLLASESVTLAPAPFADLYRRTEGWAAGLYLAALSPAVRTDGGASVASWVGRDRQLADYLTGEVLDAQETWLRRFLLRTSILQRFTAAACDAVTGSHDAATALEQLERSELFVVSLDPAREWFRYHSLFGEVLRRRLEREMPDEVSELHRRAAAWFRSIDAVREAAAHATAAGDIAGAAALVGRHWPRFVREGLVETVDGLLRALPGPAVAGDGALCLAAASVAAEQGRWADAQRWLDRADSAPQLEVDDGSPAGIAGRPGDGRDTRTGQVASLRATVELHRGDVGAAVRQARVAVATDPGGHAPWWNAAHLLLGPALWLSGDRSAALAAMGVAEELVRHSTAAMLWVVGSRAAIEAHEGDPAIALSLAERALAYAEAEHLDGHQLAAPATLAAGRALAERRRPVDAYAHNARGLELARRGRYPWLVVYGLITQAILAHADRDTGHARSLLGQARDTLDSIADAGAARVWVEQAGQRLRITSLRGRSATPASGVWDLSDRELTILRLLAAGLSQREVAEQAYVSFNTVKTHSRAILRKLGAHDRQDAIARAKNLGLL